ncbi:MAG: hypothetical protein ACRDS0_31525 [Pseudonocardiaceae bacterium]
MSTASRWAGWSRYRRGSVPSSFNAGTSEELSPRVELFLGGAWVDITRISKDQAGVYYRDKITITRGRADSAAQADPQTCSFTLNNRGGLFSLHNPMSPYYGLLSRNTPCRVSVMQNGIRRYRFYGEISSWPIQWDISGRDVYIPVVASGIKRRMQQGSAPLKSAVYRDMTSPTRTAIVGYWPLEDVAGSTTIASGLDGARPMQITAGAADFGAYSDWFGSDPLPTMGTAVTRGVVPNYTSTGQTSIRFFCKVNSAVPATYQELIRFKATGTASVWWLSLKSDGALRMISKDDGGSTVMDTTDTAFGMNTAGMRTITIQLTQDGADIDWVLLITDFVNGAAFDQGQPLSQISGTISGDTVGRITDVVLGTNGGLGDVVLGHVSIANDLDAYAFSGGSLAARNDEGPANRFRRLCAEEGINGVVISKDRVGNEVTMGSQHSATLISLLESCATTDLGMLHEPRDQAGLAYRTRLSLYNQAPQLMLDYAAHELAAALNPIDDDQKIANDLTITREDGSSARQVLSTGPLSVLDPPDGVGRYDDAPPPISLGFDDQLLNQVGWRLWLATVDEARYPQIALNLRHPSFTSDLDLMNAALTMDVGDRITIDNPPPWLPPDTIDLIVQGYTETFDQLEYTMSINCDPGSPYQVGFSDDLVYGRADTDGATIATAADETTGTISVATNGWAVEDFEDATLNIDMRAGGNAAWARSTDSVHSGTWALKSPTLLGDQFSDAVIRVPAGATTVSFWYRVSSEAGFDFFQAFVDNALVVSNSGDSGWVQATVGVGGAEDITFRYFKDPFTDVGSDAAYVDDLAFSGPPIWTTDPADFPFDVRFGGEVATVTAISGTSSPQSFSVVRSVNGVIKSHLAGTDVRLAHPPIVSL